MDIYTTLLDLWIDLLILMDGIDPDDVIDFVLASASDYSGELLWGLCLRLMVSLLLSLWRR